MAKKEKEAGVLEDVVLEAVPETAPEVQPEDKLEALAEVVRNDPALFVLFQPEFEALKAKKFDPHTAGHIHRLGEKIGVVVEAFAKIGALADDLKANRAKLQTWYENVLTELQKPAPRNPYETDRQEIYRRIMALEDVVNTPQQAPKTGDSSEFVELAKRVAALENAPKPDVVAPVSHAAEIEKLTQELAALRDGVGAKADSNTLQGIDAKIEEFKKQLDEVKNMFLTTREEVSKALAKNEALTQKEGDA